MIHFYKRLHLGVVSCLILSETKLKTKTKTRTQRDRGNWLPWQTVAGTLSVEGESGELPKDGLQQDLAVLDLLEVLVLGLEGLIMVEVAVLALS